MPYILPLTCSLFGHLKKALWAVIRSLYRHYSKFLYFSGYHLLPLTLRDDIVKQKPQLEQELVEYAYEPLVVLPQRQARYLGVKDGGRVLLRFKPPDGDELIVVAHAYSYPEGSQLWDLFDQPAVSLVLRRYFGTERLLLGKEDQEVCKRRKDIEKTKLRIEGHENLDLICLP